MFISFCKAIFLYCLVLCTLRILGKRQVGELQPADLVFTILLSEVLVLPLQDKDLPLLHALIPAAVLIGLEIIFSYINMKSSKFRKLLQGQSILIIKDGVLQQNELKRLRFTLDDLLEMLRQKDIFDISTVEYAFVETDGSISVLLKPEHLPLVLEDLEQNEQKNGFPCYLILDGELQENFLQESTFTKESLKKLLDRKRILQKDILLYSIDKYGNEVLIMKEK